MAQVLKAFLVFSGLMFLSLHVACSPNSEELKKPSNADGILGRKSFFNTKNSNSFGVIMTEGVGQKAERFTYRDGQLESSQSLIPSALQFSKNGLTVFLRNEPGIYEFSSIQVEEILSGAVQPPQATIEVLCNKINSTGYQELLVEFSSTYVFSAPSSTGKDGVGGNGAITKQEGVRYTTFQKAGFATLQIDRQVPSITETGFFKSSFLSAPAPWNNVPDMECKLNDVPVMQTTHTIFVTSTAFDGDLGNLAGADFLCQASAQAGTATRNITQGVWKAFLGSSLVSIDTRINLRANVPLVNAQGNLVLTDSSKLNTLPILLSSIRYDENGNLSSHTYAWSMSGQVFYQSCNSWNDGDVITQGPRGTIDSTSLYMNNSVPNSAPCDQPHPIFCVNSD